MDKAEPENKNLLRDKQKRGHDASVDSYDLLFASFIYQIRKQNKINNNGNKQEDKGWAYEQT
jgi:hypothetical protein